MLVWGGKTFVHDGRSTVLLQDAKNQPILLELYARYLGVMDLQSIFVYENLNCTHNQMDHLMGWDQDMDLQGINMVH